MVTINVTNVDEDGTVTLSSQGPRSESAITATLTDADGSVTGTTWQWASSDAMDGTYTNIAAATLDSYTPVEGDANMYLRATAMYTDGHGSGKSESMVSANAVSTVPAFDADTATRSVDENTAAGENIGAPVMAADDDMLTYTLSGTGASSFDIDELTGQLMTMADLDYETETTYIVTVTAKDTSEATDSVMVTINVTNVDEDGTVTLSSETKVGVAITATLTDADGSVTGTTWQWASSDAMDGTYTNIAAATLDSYTPVEGDANMYLRATAMYTDGHGSDKSESMVSANAVSTVPAFDADTATRSVDENTAAGENIGAPVMATDADDDMLTYTLSGTGASSFDIDELTGQLMTMADLDYETETTYIVTVTAKDTSEATDSVMVTINVTNVDEDGTVTLSSETKVGVAITATLTDADGSVTGTTWQWASSDAMDGTYTNIAAATLDSYTPVEGDANMYLRATAMYTDGHGSGKSESMVSANAVSTVPAFDADTATRSVDENTAAGENIGAPVMAADDDMLTYTLSGTGASSFDIDELTGQLMTMADLDYETETTYIVTVTAKDTSEATDSVMVTINVTNVDEDGTVTLSSETKVGVAITATLTDADGSVTGTTWQWASSDAMDGTYTNIAAATLDSYTPVEGDANMYLRATAMYTDGHGSGKSESMVSANAVSTVPAFDADTATRSVDENTAAGENIGAPVMAADDDMLTYTLSGTGASSFDIDELTGQLMTMADLDYETETTYIVTVTAKDTSEATDSVMVTINVTNVDEDGTVTLSSETKVGVAITATLTDADGSVTGTTWQWASSDAMDGTYTNIAAATLDSYTPVEGDANMYLRATAMYTDGHGSGKSESMVSANAVSTVPAFDADTATRSVDENTAAGENIGAPVMATDADDDMLTYTLSGTGASSFDIDELTGQLMTMADLDYETETTYIVTVTAKDTSEATDSVMVTINVTNVDEDGTVTLSSETKVGVAITATLTDADGSVTGTTWQWASSDAMDGTYTNIAAATLDSYTPVEGDANMYLRATAMYTDGHGSGKSESMVSANAVSTVPAFDADTATRSVDENTAAGENIGAPVMATDRRRYADLHPERHGRVFVRHRRIDRPAHDHGGPGLRDGDDLHSDGHG